MVIKAWWFAPSDRRLQHGDGRIIRVGRTHVHKGHLHLCMSGLHASRRILDALAHAPGPVLCRVECDGSIVEAHDKLVCNRRTYLAVVDATELLRKFARLCALDVIDKWDAPDVVVRYLRTGDEKLRDAAWAAARDAAGDAARDAAGDAAWDAAWAAARDAARDAARAAAWDAAWDAAGDAAWDAQNRRLHRMAMKLIRETR